MYTRTVKFQSVDTVKVCYWFYGFRKAMTILKKSILNL